MVHIRSGTPSDRAELRRIQKGALSEPAPALLESGTDGPLGLLVATDPEPVGYVLFLPGETRVVILEVAVEPPRQGEGVGSKLLDETLSRLEHDGYAAVHLTARLSDRRVHEFYEHHGFERKQVLPDFFETDDGVVFVQDL